MKRTLLAVAAVLALGSASAYAQTADVVPSFNDAPDLTQNAPTGKQPSASARNNVQTTDRYAQSSHGATRSDASSSAGSSAASDAGSNANSDRGFGAGSKAHEPAETLNDTFHYPTSD
jgi:curli biogenesis system outer membrane secretion channel CsgG